MDASDDLELTTLLATHAVHGDLVRAGYVCEVAPGRHQVVHPPAILADIKSGKLTGRHAVVAAGLVLLCTPPKGFWYAQTPEELIDRLMADQPL